MPWLRFVVVLLLVALDQWTKQAVFSWFAGGPDGLTRDHHDHLRFVLVDDWLALMRSENPGAAFGRLGDWPRILVTGRVIAVTVLFVSLWRTRREHTLLLWGVVLVLSGAAGNLIDNLMLDPPGPTEAYAGHPFGLVRDFIDVYFGVWDWHFPTFNVADSCITVGAACFLLYGFFHREPEEEPGPGPRPETGPADA